VSADPRTIAVYDAKAKDYADRFATAKPDRALAAFIAALPAGARVLDLGCGPGTASAFLRAAGHLPDPMDASPETVALANARHAIGARIADFDAVTEVAAYDGVWANFSLLHAPRSAMPRYLAALHRALKPGGLLHLGMKTGSGEARDGLDRMYTYYDVDELQALLRAAGFTPTALVEGTERGLAGTDDPFALLTAHA
jgi:SAM-dependent methyltransferase